MQPFPLQHGPWGHLLRDGCAAVGCPCWYPSPELHGLSLPWSFLLTHRGGFVLNWL